MKLNASSEKSTVSTAPVKVQQAGGSGAAGVAAILTKLTVLPDSNYPPRGKWGALSDYVSPPFVLTAEGICRGADSDTGEPMLVAGPVIVKQVTRGITGDMYGLQVVALTLDDHVVKMAIPATKLHGDAFDLARMLADTGIRIVPGKERLLLSYLDSARVLAAKRDWLNAVHRTGWVDGDTMAFVLPDCIIGIENAVYQPEGYTAIRESCTAAGTLEEWKQAVASHACRSDLGIFILAASLAAALVRPAHSDTFGFHLHGLTSRGKTTALQLAASVWGRGSDPGADARAYIQRWNGTANSFEVIAYEHGDIALCLDEAGQFRDPKALGALIYNLASGKGASRLKSDASRRRTRDWRTVLFSTGEAALSEFMEQAGQHQKGGQAIRILDIPMHPDGLFPEEADPAALVNAVKRHAGEWYGSAGRAFLAWLVSEYQTHDVAYTFMRPLLDIYAQELASKASPSEIQRAAGRFALVRVAGLLAIRAGILDVSEECLSMAVARIWLCWRSYLPDVDDGKRAICAIADFIRAHPGQFPDTSEKERLPSQVAGYRKEGFFLFTKEGLKAAIGDIAWKIALHALETAGLIFKNEAKHHTTKHEVASLGRQTRLYAIRAVILDADIPVTPVSGGLAGQGSERTQQGATPLSPPPPYVGDEPLF